MSDKPRQLPASGHTTGNLVPVSDFISPQEMRRTRVSPLSRPAWRLLLMAVAGSVLASGGNRLWGASLSLTVWFSACLAGFAWVAAVRFLLLDSRGRRFWLVWLGASMLGLLISNAHPAGMYVAASFAGIFLIFRRYRPYRHLTSARRAGMFFLGLLSVAALIFGWFFGPQGESASWLHRFGLNLLRYLLFSLQLFWWISLVRLFISMRLHFLRLKLKLAISYLFIALVPLVLIAVFGLLTLYAALGGRSASRGRAVLDHWSHLVASGSVLGESPFGSQFTWRQGEAQPLVRGEAPLWLDNFSTCLTSPLPGLATPDGDETENDDGSDGYHLQFGENDDDDAAVYWAPRDTTAFFHCFDELWLMRLSGVGSAETELTGYRLDAAAMDSLSTILGADVSFYLDEGMVLGAGNHGRADAAERDTTRGGVNIRGLANRERPAPADSNLSFWNRPLEFGGSIVQVIQLSPDGFYFDSLLLRLQARVADLGREFITDENPINQVLVILFAVCAFLFLVLEMAALYFGIRITTGITSAVALLHKGTQRLASGDLDVRIEIPNEDEFGDLAASFNEMTAAVKRGQEQALARVRLERELQTAREIQERLLPDEVPASPGFEVTGISVPSRQVGGDYFDFLAQDDGKLGVAIGDVSGKGIPAALLMSNLQASLQGAGHPPEYRGRGGRKGQRPAGAVHRYPHVRHLLLRGPGLQSRHLHLHQRRAQPAHPVPGGRSHGTAHHRWTHPRHDARDGVRTGQCHPGSRGCHRALYRRHHRGGGSPERYRESATGRRQWCPVGCTERWDRHRVRGGRRRGAGSGTGRGSGRHVR
ncbi:MAG: HAMP domain-containing protein [bacterium]